MINLFFVMKKLLLFALIISILFSLTFVSSSTLSETFRSDVVNYFAYVNNLNNINCSNYEVIQNGNGAIIKTEINKAKQILTSGCSVAGECVEVNKNYGLNNIIKKLNLKLEKTEEFSGRVLITGYSNVLPTSLSSNGKKLNIQIAETENSYLIGYPLILHSY